MTEETKEQPKGLFDKFMDLYAPLAQQVLSFSPEDYAQDFREKQNYVLKQLGLISPTSGVTTPENTRPAEDIIMRNGSQDQPTMDAVEQYVNDRVNYNPELGPVPVKDPNDPDEYRRNQMIEMLEINRMFDGLLQADDFALPTINVDQRSAYTSHLLSVVHGDREALAKKLVSGDLKALEGLDDINAFYAGFDRETQMEELEVPGSVAAVVDGVDAREPDDSQYVKSELNKAVQKRLQGPREPNDIRELKIEQEKALSPNLSKVSEDLKDQALQIQSVASGNPIDFVYKNKLYGLDETNVEHQKTIRAMFDTFVPGFIKNNKELTTGKAAWCAVFVAHVLKNLHGDAFETLVHTRNARGGKKDAYNRIRAKHYGSLGKKVSLNKARKGDLVIKEKNGQWHVGFFVEAKNGTVAILGGNQDNEVNITFYDESEIKFIRRLDGSVDIGSENVKRIEEDIAATSSKPSTSQSTR